jgi:hypothetical protein
MTDTSAAPAADHVHKATKKDPSTCRICGAPMGDDDAAIAASFDAALAASPATTGGTLITGSKCIQCGADLPTPMPGQELPKCCEACGLLITWENNQPHQELTQTVAPTTPVSTNGTGTSQQTSRADANPTRPTSLLADPDTLPTAPAANSGYFQAIVRCNRDIHNRQRHPDYPAPYDPTPHTFEVHGPKVLFGRAMGEEPHDSEPDRVVAYDNAVSEDQATFERLDDGTWELRVHGRNPTWLNHASVARQDPNDPAGTGHPVKSGDVLWAGYYTELEIVALA